MKEREWKEVGKDQELKKAGESDGVKEREWKRATVGKSENGRESDIQRGGSGWERARARVGESTS